MQVVQAGAFSLVRDLDGRRVERLADLPPFARNSAMISLFHALKSIDMSAS